MSVKNWKMNIYLYLLAFYRLWFEICFIFFIYIIDSRQTFMNDGGCDIYIWWDYMSILLICIKPLWMTVIVMSIFDEIRCLYCWFASNIYEWWLLMASFIQPQKRQHLDIVNLHKPRNILILWIHISIVVTTSWYCEFT